MKTPNEIKNYVEIWKKTDFNVYLKIMETEGHFCKNVFCHGFLFMSDHQRWRQKFVPGPSILRKIASTLSP
jgi:hypothetical protein